MEAMLFDQPFADNVRMRERASNAMEVVFYGHAGRPADKWHHYLEIYDRYLSRYRGQRMRLLEIGVQRGGSLQVWKKYLGERASICGLDIDPRSMYSEPQISVVIGSQSSPSCLQGIAEREDDPLDVVIDDGSHFAADQLVTFTTLYPMMAADGVYICEDIHTAYWQGNGLFLVLMKQMIDQLHAWYRDEGDLRVAQTTYAVHFYDSVIVIEKRTQKRPFRALVGSPPDPDPFRVRTEVGNRNEAEPEDHES